MTPTGPHDDGCTLWFDGSWRHCCDTHDAAYAAGTVDLTTHLDLAACVAATGWPLIGLIMGAATAIWWVVRYRIGRRRSEGGRG